MKIKSIEAFTITVPPKPMKTQPRRSSWVDGAEVANPMSRFPEYKPHRSLWTTKWQRVACVVTAEDGTWGLGITDNGPVVTSIINDHFAGHLTGREVMATEYLWDMMYRMVAPYGAWGLASYAISAVDLALWDLKGKLLELPVYALLGGPSHDTMPCYATGYDTDWHLECGFSGTKLPCPYGASSGLEGLIAIEELVAKTRELIGPRVELMLDCWMAFDVEFAIRLAERLRPYDMKWIEDCLIPEDFEGFDEMRRRLPWLTLATGEHWYTPLPYAQAVARRSVDILQPDVIWMGGVTAIQKVCHLAEAAGISVIPHAGLNDAYGQHVCYAFPGIPSGEFFVGSPPGVPLDESPTQRNPGRMAVPVEGRFKPYDDPGFGLGLTLEEVYALRDDSTPRSGGY